MDRRAHTGRRPAWLAALSIVLGLSLAHVFVSQQSTQQPTQQIAAEAPNVVQVAPPVEARAGGVQVKGEWRFGYTPNPEASARFVRSLPKPFLAQAGPELLARADDDATVLLYRALYEAYKAHHSGQDWIVGRQGIGDCVSWGWAHGADMHLAVRWKLGETSEWRSAATEAIYGGSRVEARCGSDTACKGGWGDGSYGAAAAKWVHDWGVVFRQPYDGLADLSIYDSSRAKQWGNYGCGGKSDQGKLDAIAKTHPIKNVVLVRSFAEAAAAISAGYPIPVCSGQGFSSSRDSEGFCRASGSWAHCMCFVGVRHGSRPGLLCLNSWGPNWVKGPKWPEDQPDGSFWVDAKVADRMLSRNDSFAVSGYEGFPYRDLKHGDWVQVDPDKVRGIERRIASRWGRSRVQRGELALAP